MNLKTGLKTLAVAVPMAITPMKSAAQNVAKEVAKTPTEYTARLGLGYGRTAFFEHMNYEPAIVGSIGARSRDVVAGLDAKVGKGAQDFKAFVGVPGREGKAGHVDVGMVARYQHYSPSAFKGVILDCEVNNLKEFPDAVSLNRSKGFIGGYVAPTLKVGDVDITPHAEAGMGFLADFGSKASVARETIPEIVADERITSRSNAKFSTNLGLSIDAALDSGVRAGLDVNHSSFDNSTSFMAKITYEIDRLFKGKK